MNIFLWILQGLLALHTAMGAVWKFSNSEQSVPTLSRLPHAIWMGLSGLELLCAVGLVLPALLPPFGPVVPVAAACIGAEMLLFVVVHLTSGNRPSGEVVYWLVVLLFSGFLAYARAKLNPL